jgi:hypothetical protein
MAPAPAPHILTHPHTHPQAGKARTLLHFLATKEEYDFSSISSRLEFTDAEDKYLELIRERLEHKMRSTYPHWEEIRVEVGRPRPAWRAEVEEALTEAEVAHALALLKPLQMDTCTEAISSMARSHGKVLVVLVVLQRDRPGAVRALIPPPPTHTRHSSWPSTCRARSGCRSWRPS